MSEQTVYLITGANRGIGLQMTSTLLSRPSTTIIATVRDTAHPTAQSLSSLPTHASSRIHIVPFDAADVSPAQPLADLLSVLLTDGVVSGIDVVIANAGASAGGFNHDTLTVDPAVLRADFEVNAIGPIRLFQAAWPLLSKRLGDSDAAPAAQQQGEAKFVLITSSVGSVGILEQEPMPGASYGASKAAANWLSKKISVEHKAKGLLVGIIHPGWVKTAMGQSLADSVGFAEPPMTVEDSSKGVLEQIDGLTAEKSGKFLHVTGQELPW